MKIGIFGGTFDPWHVGHSAIVKAALKKVDKVIIVPTTCDYYRGNYLPLFSFDDRCTVIKEFMTGLDHVELDTIEKDKDKNWRTYHTLKYFKEKFPNDELYLIIGEDSLANFTTWFRYDDLLLMAKLLVAYRGVKLNVDLPYEMIDIGTGFVETSATSIRDKLKSELLDMYLSDKEWYND